MVPRQGENGSAAAAEAGDRGRGSSSPSPVPPPPPPLRFSSYSLLEGGDGATGSLGLPTGALFAPFARLQPSPAQIPRQPILCTHCAAYPNPFCEVDAATGGWRCCFCKKDNPCYAEDFIGSSPAEHRDSYPEMTYKAVEYSEQNLAGVLSGMSALTLATGPHRHRDRAAAAPAHVFVVDGNMRDAALADLASSVEKVVAGMEADALLSLVVFTGVVSVYRLGKAGASVADVFPGGETLPPEEVERRLSEGEKNHFVPVHAGKEALCTALKLLRGVGDGSQRSGAAGGGGGRGSDASGTNGLRRGSGRQGRTWGGSRRGPVPPHKRKRCLGAAVEYALRLGSTADRPSARLLVCLGGCPNFGPGAVAPCVPGAAAAEVEPDALAAATEYFEDLGTRALLQGTGVDVFCSGNEALGAAALQALVAPTGGYVLILPSFSEHQFAGNLAKSIGEQSMSDGDGLHGCIIDVRSSVGMDLQHVIGPAESTEDYDDVDKEAEEASAAAARISEGRSVASATMGVSSSTPAGGVEARGEGADTPRVTSVSQFGLGKSYHRLVIGRVDPRTSLALYFDGPGTTAASRKSRRRGSAAARGVKDGQEDEEDYVMFQFVVRQPGSGAGRTTRVLTHRLPVTADEQGFLQTVDPEAVAVLVAKEAVLRATYGIENGTNQLEVEEARVGVDAVVHEVSTRYRQLKKSPRSVKTGGGQQVAIGGSGSVAPSLEDIEGGNAGGFTAPTPTPAGGVVNGRGAEMPSLPSAQAAVSAGSGEQSGTGTNEGERGGRIEEDPEGMVFPRELGWLPIRLFHLRRGPLLGPLLQNSDDPLCMRHLFLRGALEECLRMMAPELLSMKATAALTALSSATAVAPPGVEGGGAGREAALERLKALLPLEGVPVETLAMLPDRILVLDTHDRVFVWSGATVCGAEFDRVREACADVFASESHARYPSANVVFLKDGSSWSRYLTSRLIPSHKDSIDDQVKSFPGLAGVPEEELDELRAKLPQTDDESFREFFWDVCNPN